MTRTAVAVALAAGFAASCGPGTAFPTTTTTVRQPCADTCEGYIAGNRALFAADKIQIESTLRAQPNPELTAFVFDAASDEVRATFAYSQTSSVSDSRRDTFAWNVAQTLSQSFWFPELVADLRAQGLDPAWLPGLRITLDRKIYLCPSDVQIAMADEGVGREDWLRRCSR